jgi:undecaprenyl-diphosphatase
VDLTLFKALNGIAHSSDWFEDPASFLAQDLQFFFVALLAGLFLARGKWASRNGRHAVVAAGFAIGLGLLVAHVFAGVWDRPRPYLAHGDAHLYIGASHDSSFPSDHATAAFAIAVSILLRNRRVGWVAVAMAVVLSVSRVAVGTHYPSDVLTGAAIGTLAALFFWLPTIRRPLGALADWAGAVYERSSSRVSATAAGWRASRRWVTRIAR